jgi:hypothetical protein
MEREEGEWRGGERREAASTKRCVAQILIPTTWRSLSFAAGKAAETGFIRQTGLVSSDRQD